jgi:hypothetical protein
MKKREQILNKIDEILKKDAGDFDLTLIDVLEASEIETHPDYILVYQASGLYLSKQPNPETTERVCGEGVYWDIKKDLKEQNDVVFELLGKYFLKAEDLGLIKKYNLSRVDGEELDPDSKYFVLRYDQGAEENHRNASRDALSMYISRIYDTHRKLAEDLSNDLKEEIKKGLK